MSPEPAHLPPAPERVSFFQRVLGLALAGAAGVITLGLVLVFAVVAFFSGHGVLGTVLLLLLLLAGVGTTYLGVQTARRGLRRGKRQLQQVQGELGLAREHLDQRAARRELAVLWNRFGSQVPAEVRPALRGAIAATDEALRAAEDEPLGRARYEAQQAAREDLPALIELHQRSGGHSAELLQSLALIENRMRRIAMQIAEDRQREAALQREYLNGKYAADLLESDPHRP